MRSRDPDARLAERALREAWPVPEGRRAELVAKLIDVALAEDTPPRERVSAVKALLMAGRLNIEAIRTAQAADYEDVLERLEALRHPSPPAGEAAEGRWGGLPPPPPRPAPIEGEGD